MNNYDSSLERALRHADVLRNKQKIGISTVLAAVKRLLASLGGEPSEYDTEPETIDKITEMVEDGGLKAAVGLGNVDNVRQYSADNPPPYPVISVDGNTGAVQTYDVKAWTPVLYDNNTELYALPAQLYVQVGPMVFCTFDYTFTSDTVFSTMIQVRGLPVTTSWGGNVYFGSDVTGRGGTTTIQGNISGGRLLLRPNITGTIHSGTRMTGLFIGMTDEPIPTAYSGDYVVTPLAFEQTVLDTSGKKMADDVTVLEVPYYEVSNTSGKTVYIADTTND